MGARVLAYAESLEGRQVGDGECFTLAAAALTHAGARAAFAYGNVTPESDYVWGRPVDIDRLQPGDVLQFRNFSITTQVTTIMKSPDGNETSSQSERVDVRDHHTAIVEQASDGSVVVLEQNVDPAGRVVQRNRIALVSLSQDQVNSAAYTRVITQTRVEGSVRAYRPEVASAAELADAAAMLPGADTPTPQER